MSLVKFAKDNKNYKGFKTKQVWASRGIGAAGGAAIGAALGKGPGALVGGALGAGLGDATGKIMRLREIAAKEGYKRPTTRALFSVQAYHDAIANTPADSAMAQLDPSMVLSGAIIRGLNKK